MTDCQPGRLCPDHTIDPGLLVLLAATLLATLLAAVALVALLAVIATAAGAIRRRITRATRPATATPAAKACAAPSYPQGAAEDFDPAEEQDLALALGDDRPARVVARTLYAHGYTLATVQHATDAQLRAVPGIGNTSLTRIRAHIPPPADRPAAAPAPHLAVIAAALDDWWTTADPAATFDGDTIAPHVEMYLLSSGYHVTPNP